MDGAQTPVAEPAPQLGVDPSKVPAAVQAEFGKREFDKQTKTELDALERDINARLAGESPQSAAAPQLVAPAQAAPAPLQQAPAAPQQVQVQPAPVAPVQATLGVQVPPGVQVPDKFKLPDGTMDAQKVEQALVNIEAYLQRERELTRMKQGLPPAQYPPVQPPQQPYPQGYVPAPPQGWPQMAPSGYEPGYQPQPGYAPLEERVNQDLARDPGATVVNLMRAAVMNAQESAEAKVRDLNMKLELMEIAQKDKGVFTREGIEALHKVRIENPWLSASPTPWTHAYQLLGRPIAPTVGAAPATPAQVQGLPAQHRPTAPILPGGQMPQAPQPAAPAVQAGASETDLRRYLSEKHPNNPMAQAEAVERIMRELSQRRG